ncbi:hypothetical protein C2G38_593379 [Gigaspora rosea]|uniref:Fibronectin type-III domain-containing protein n=1 Tax=Gigaspora rosea TaxID=44941 RepID=A0A397U5F6_9GLOM|nr:hypothetical protein C2G38_593379 [Gigaspora rosea]
MNRNLIFTTLFLLLTMPFMLNTNNGWSDCSINGIQADVLNVSWGPDPVGPTGMTMFFNVSQGLSQASTTFTKLVVSFNDPSGVISSANQFEISPGINSVDNSYQVMVPDLIPSPVYTVAVMLTEVGIGDVLYCVLFSRDTRSG